MYAIKIVDEQIWWDGNNWNDEKKTAKTFFTIKSAIKYAQALAPKHPDVIMELVPILALTKLKGRYVFCHLTGVKAEENGTEETGN